MTSHVFVNVRLLDPASGLDAMGGLVVEDGKIVAAGANIRAGDAPEGATVIDGDGHCLAPGLIDSRVFVGEPGAEHKETLASASQSAAAGGVTTIITMPSTKPAIDGVSLVEYMARRRSDDVLVNVVPMAAATKRLEGKEMTEIGLLTNAGAVAFTDGRTAVADASVMMKILKYGRMFDALLVQHPEEPTLSKGVMNAGELSTRLGLSGSTPLAELLMIERDIRLAEATGGRLHFAHVTAAGSLAAVRAAKARGIRITCGVTPPHFALNELVVGDYRTFAKISPPLRAEDDRLAVIEGLKDGTIDVIASGHDPQDAESKRLPFAQAAFGAVGLETLLPVSMELYHNGYLSLLEVIDRLTRRPAELFKLPGGRLAVGAPADLVLFDPDLAIRIDADRFRSKSKNTPFDEQPAQGKVMLTMVGGRVVYSAQA
ncbi:dihydroorotase [Govanella unica]|uniref:Dihydroorotase n=1 Tax=Govanella unica TaxID=2975056 RepID=A0A9X3TWR6_9PROT|nr:dihydroorotase [Govania unica]MDA5193120.1 dihydroorotase [Govania unica]